MTPQDFLDWLNSEIEKAARNEKAQDYDLEAVEFCKGYGEALKDARAKFLTISFPTEQETDDKNFINGLD